jgi:hypothetical protein
LRRSVAVRFGFSVPAVFIASWRRSLLVPKPPCSKRGTLLYCVASLDRKRLGQAVFWKGKKYTRGGTPWRQASSGLVCRRGSADRALGDRCAWGQIESRFPPAPVFAQDLQQRQIAIFAALAGHHADDHSLAIDIAHLEASEFCASHTGAVEGHQQRASKHSTPPAVDAGPGDRARNR